MYNKKAYKKQRTKANQNIQKNCKISIENISLSERTKRNNKTMKRPKENQKKTNLNL